MSLLFLFFFFLTRSSWCFSQPMLDSLNGNPIDPDEMGRIQQVQEKPVPLDDKDPTLNLKNGGAGQGIIHGDIVMPADSSDNLLRNAIRNPNLKWPGGVIPYIIANSFSQDERLVIAKAMASYHEKTCIKFVPRTSQSDYIYIMKGQGCYSGIGRTGGSQDVSLGSGCVYTGIAIHELMHAVGFWHEQSRDDRDDYINIIWGNIQQSMQYNFQKMTLRDIDHLGEPYDTCSVMHYNAYAFSMNPSQPTIVRKANSGATCELGQRNGFSAIDVAKINKLYTCQTTAAGLGTTSESGSGEKPTSECVDVDKNCAAWQKLGECEKNPSWMLPNCPSACKQCDLKCKDYSPHCARWAELGECDKNRPYMSAYCVDSCHCSKKQCEDQAKDCKYWAEKGNCKDAVYGEYMKLRCKKSCGFCDASGKKKRTIE